FPYMSKQTDGKQCRNLKGKITKGGSLLSGENPGDGTQKSNAIRGSQRKLFEDLQQNTIQPRTQEKTCPPGLDWCCISSLCISLSIPQTSSSPRFWFHGR
uniref:Uncharacterized protein n=1 Tax=Dromaius novaehollandiae TaxID=8790 RepID=A0A8C4PEL5_DRONO